MVPQRAIAFPFPPSRIALFSNRNHFPDPTGVAPPSPAPPPADRKCPATIKTDPRRQLKLTPDRVVLRGALPRRGPSNYRLAAPRTHAVPPERDCVPHPHEEVCLIADHDTPPRPHPRILPRQNRRTFPPAVQPASSLQAPSPHYHEEVCPITASPPPATTPSRPSLHPNHLPNPNGIASLSPGLAFGTKAYPGSPTTNHQPHRGCVPRTSATARRP